MGWIANYVSSIVEEKTPLWWWLAIGFTSSVTLLLLGSVVYLVSTGVGVWGNNHPVGWAWDITNFVFWIGIGHAGTLISAILFPHAAEMAHVNQPRRRGDDALCCHLRRPLSGLHVGRVWMAWFLAPVPNANGIWQNFRSPLLLGRLRGLDVFHRLSPLLVHRPHSRSRHAPRPREHEDSQIHLRHHGPRLARREPAVEALRDGLPRPRGPLHATRPVGALGRIVRLCHISHPRLARRQSSRHISLRAQSSAASRWCSRS